jgi:tetraacyldisaccharide 4'-kinase
LENWLESIWYEGREPPWWVRILTPLYRIAYLIHRRYGQSKQPSDLAGRRIIVVGNLTAGGAGKTPVVIHLCRLLVDAGFKPGVISRGYGGKRSRNAKRRILPVTAESSPAESGDEAVMIAKRAGVPVLVGEDRCRAARLHFAQGLDVVISDDGLQHHRLPRSLEICVIDGVRGFGNGQLIPAGPLRESLDRLNSVDYILVNNAEASNQWRSELDRVIPADSDGTAGSAWHDVSIVPGQLISLDRDQSWRLSQFRGCKASAVAGIGNNTRFFNMLEKAGIHITEYGFPDHHAYQESDFAALDKNLPVIMTEKDAIKCTGLGLKNAWYLVIDTILPMELEQEILNRMAQCQSGNTPGKGFP